jgi:SAM-dependent methyltransferase
MQERKPADEGMDSITPGDWNGVWGTRFRLHLASANFPDNIQRFGDRETARRYDTSNREKFAQRIEDTLADLNPGPESRILDIGAGPGTLAIPLSKRAREICAVEPAQGMVAVLRERLDKEKISNIRVIPIPWEDVDAQDLDPPYDCVLAALSLGMEDLRAAVKKMQEVACGTVNLYWFADTPFWERMCIDLWPELHGSPYYPQPLLDTLYQVLYHMGILANVQIRTLENWYTFSSEKEMCDHFCPAVGASSHRQQDLVAHYLLRQARASQDVFFIPAASRYARVWWRV